jgi:MSHA pilin protein MshD
VNRDQRGATLIELIVAIVIIAGAAGTIVGLLAAMSGNSANAMSQVQSASIANAYLDEILARSFADPGGPVEAGRADADDVGDYRNASVLPDTLVRDRQGVALAEFANYRVAVAVTQPSWTVAGWPAIPGANVWQVTVRVTSPTGEVTQLVGLKSKHP